MKKSKIILAGSGYLGNYLIDILLKNGSHQEIVELSRTRRKRQKHITVLSRDFDDKTIDLDCAKSGEIIYMAPPNKDGKKDIRISNFITNIKKFNIKKIVYISTSGVYGNCNGSLVDEEHKTNPLTDRAIRRMDAEQQLTKHCETRKIKLIILRTPGIYGKDRLPIERIKNGEPVIRKEESRVTNLIHVEDLARVVLSAVNSDKLKMMEIINVSDGNAVTSTEFYETVCEVMGVKIQNYITYEDAKKVYTSKRLSFLSESRTLNTEKMFRLMPGCIKYKDLREGVRASISSQAQPSN